MTKCKKKIDRMSGETVHTDSMRVHQKRIIYTSRIIWFLNEWKEKNNRKSNLVFYAQPSFVIATTNLLYFLVSINSHIKLCREKLSYNVKK